MEEAPQSIDTESENDEHVQELEKVPADWSPIQKGANQEACQIVLTNGEQINLASSFLRTDVLAGLALQIHEKIFTNSKKNKKDASYIP